MSSCTLSIFNTNFCTFRFQQKSALPYPKTSTLKRSPPGTRAAAMRTMPISKTVTLTRNVGSISERQLCKLTEKQVLRTTINYSAVFWWRITYAWIVSEKAGRLKRISDKAHLGLPPLGWNLEQTLLEDSWLIDFLPFKAGSEQRPHQKTQSTQRGSSTFWFSVKSKRLKKEKKSVPFLGWVGGAARIWTGVYRAQVYKPRPS